LGRARDADGDADERQLASGGVGAARRLARAPRRGSVLAVPSQRLPVRARVPPRAHSHAGRPAGDRLPPRADAGYRARSGAGRAAPRLKPHFVPLSGGEGSLIVRPITTGQPFSLASRAPTSPSAPSSPGRLRSRSRPRLGLRRLGGAARGRTRR